MEGLLKPENKEKLASILKYHVVAGRVYSSDALAAGKAKTLQGESIKISSHGKAAKVNDAKLLKVDLDASNGVIHVIDSVILPQNGKQAARHPRRMIESAIAKGAPLYNAGHTARCARIYESAVRNMLSSENAPMPTSVRHTLTVALNSAEHSQCENTRAWTLRRAMDTAYASLR